MKNRIPDCLSALERRGQPSQPTFQELRNLAQRQIAVRLRQVEQFVEEHPASGIGAAFGIGIFLGWIIKRK